MGPLRTCRSGGLLALSFVLLLLSPTTLLCRGQEQEQAQAQGQGQEQALDSSSPSPSSSSAASVADLTAKLHKAESELNLALAEASKWKEAEGRAGARAADLQASLSALEARLEDEVSLRAALKKEAEEKEDSLKHEKLLVEAKLKAQETQTRTAETLRQKKDQELENLQKDVRALAQKLEASEKQVEEKDGLLAALEKELPAHGQGASATASGAGIALVERLKQTVVQHNILAKEAERLKADVAALERKLRDADDTAAALKTANAELRKIKERLAKVEQEAEAKAAQLEEVAQLWLPPWLADKLQSAVEQAKDTWTSKVVPAAVATKERARHVLMEVQAQTQPHIENAVRSGREFVASTQETIKPHWEAAKARHAETMVVVGAKAAELSAWAAPHVDAAMVWLKQAMEQVRVLLAPYLGQAHDFLHPYLTEVWEAVRPHVEAAHAALKPHMDAATEALRPQLQQLHATWEKVDKWNVAFTLAMIVVPLYLALFVVRNLFFGRSKRTTAAGSRAGPRRPGVPSSKARHGKGSATAGKARHHH